MFETVRCASRSSMGSGSSIGSSMGVSPVKRLGSLGGGQASLTSSLSMSSSSLGPRMSSLPGLAPSSGANSSMSTHPAPHIYGSTMSFPSLDSAGQSDSEIFSNDSEDNISYVSPVSWSSEYLLLASSIFYFNSFFFSIAEWMPVSQFRLSLSLSGLCLV